MRNCKPLQRESILYRRGLKFSQLLEQFSLLPFCGTKKKVETHTLNHSMCLKEEKYKQAMGVNKNLFMEIHHLHI
jgi:hypothetical protein